jgi:hypothetical protein
MSRPEHFVSTTMERAHHLYDILQHARLEIPMDLGDPSEFSPSRPASVIVLNSLIAAFSQFGNHQNPSLRNIDQH